MKTQIKCKEIHVNNSTKKNRFLISVEIRKGKLNSTTKYHFSSIGWQI